MAALREGGDAFVYIAAATDFEHVATEGIRAFLGDNDRRFRFVLGASRTASWPAAGAGPRIEDLDAGVVVVDFVVSVFVVFCGEVIGVASAAVGGGGVVFFISKVKGWI